MHGIHLCSTRYLEALNDKLDLEEEEEEKFLKSSVLPLVLNLWVVLSFIQLSES